MYLTLPLPITKKWRHEVFYIPWDLEKPHLKVSLILGTPLAFAHADTGTDLSRDQRRCNIQRSAQFDWSLDGR